MNPNESGSERLLPEEYAAIRDHHAEHTNYAAKDVGKLCGEINHLRTELSRANDAAAKGEQARLQAAGMEAEIKELRGELSEIGSALLHSSGPIVPGRDGEPVELKPNLVYAAKQLVNERARLRAELEKVKGELAELIRGGQVILMERDAAQQQLAQARRDGERLDWLEKNAQGADETEFFQLDCIGADSVRQAIDAAMQSKLRDGKERMPQ